MPRKYRHIKDDEKELIEYKTGNRPLFYLKFNSSANSAVFDCLHNPGQFTERCLLFTIMLW